MAAYSGSALYADWVYSGGTITLQGDSRQMDYTPSIELIEESAGADGNKLYVTGIKDGQVSYSAVMQASGTALSNALAEGTQGTLTIGPEGTATGKQKIIMPAIAMGAQFRIPYNDIVELSCDFQQNGARTDTVY